MRFHRYSAADMFGAPLDNIDEQNGPGVLKDLMEAYGIEPTEVPAEPTDITPPYWLKPAFRYFLSMAHPEGPAVLDLLPVSTSSESHLLGTAGPLMFSVKGVRSFEIPNDVPAATIIGPGPRFFGQLCVHELVTFTE
jgi:hypothetical protein